MSPDSALPAATARDGEPVAALVREGYYIALRRGEIIKRDWFSVTGGPAGVVIRSTHTKLAAGVLEKSAEMVCDRLWRPRRLRLDFPDDTSMLFLFGNQATLAAAGPTSQPEATYQPIGRHPTAANAGPVFPLMHGMLYLPMLATRRLVALDQRRLQFGTIPSGLCQVDIEHQRGLARMRIEIAAAVDELSLRMDEAGHLLGYQSEAQKLDVHFVERSPEC